MKVTIAPPSLPKISLTANPESVAHNGSSKLTWRSQDATSCAASGGWSGTKALSGSEAVGPLTANSVFNLDCSNDTDHATRSVTVTVTQQTTRNVALSWIPPTTNADNTGLADLAGYRIYYGTSVGNYPNKIDITNVGIATYVIEGLVPATYHFVVTAFDKFGNESKQSNIVNKTVF